MNLKKYILILPLLLLIAAQSYGEEKNGAAFNYFAPSPRLIAKSQMMQELEANRENIFSQFSQQSESITNKQAQGEYKNRGTAFIRSLILPGAGERYLGKKTLAKTFLITEITLWVGYFAFKEYGNWIREDAIAFAATHSGAITDGKPSQFFVDIGNYRDIDEYNDAKQRMWRFDKIYKTVSVKLPVKIMNQYYNIIDKLFIDNNNMTVFKAVAFSWARQLLGGFINNKLIHEYKFKELNNIL